MHVWQLTNVVRLWVETVDAELSARAAKEGIDDIQAVNNRQT